MQYIIVLLTTVDLYLHHKTVQTNGMGYAKCQTKDLKILCI